MIPPILGLAGVALIAMILTGIFAALAITYRRDRAAARTRVAALQRRVTHLTAELEASKDWNAELRQARAEVAEMMHDDRPELEKRKPEAGLLDYLYGLPAVVPPHERGNQ